MTENDYINLDPSLRYEFYLYWGVTKYGYLAEQENIYYIIRPTSENRNKPPKEVGFAVKLEQIEKWKPISAHDNRSFSEKPISFDANLYANTLVIFGAGASFDYSFKPTPTLPKDREIVPPLADNLFCDDFEKIIQNYPGARSLCSQILKAKNIEEYFQKQWQKVEQSHNVLLLHKLINTQYYLRHLFQDISSRCNEERRNNYYNLIQTLFDLLVSRDRNERILLTTFNYDTLLEKALKQVNYNYNRIDDYINTQNKFIVFKPHGSWNWGRSIDESFFVRHDINQKVFTTTMHDFLYTNQISYNEFSESLNSEIEVLHPGFASWESNYFPSLLIPFSQKDEFIMPSRHQTTLEYFLPRIKKIIAIGWKGTELSFQNLLKKHLYNSNVEVIYVNLKDDNFEKEMMPYLPNARYKQFAPFKESKGTFSEFTEFLGDNERLILNYEAPLLK